VFTFSTLSKQPKTYTSKAHKLQWHISAWSNYFWPMGHFRKTW